MTLKMRTIEGVLPKIPQQAMYTPYILHSSDNSLAQYMGRWYFL